jgi:hypothetical protein
MFKLVSIEPDGINLLKCLKYFIKNSKFLLL